MKGKILLKNKIKEYINNYLVLKLEGGGDHSQAGGGGGDGENMAQDTP